MQLSKEGKIGFREHFREARAKAIANAEGYQEVLFALERLGTALSPKILHLGGYEAAIRKIAGDSPLAVSLPRSHLKNE